MPLYYSSLCPRGCSESSLIQISKRYQAHVLGTARTIETKDTVRATQVTVMTKMVKRG